MQHCVSIKAPTGQGKCATSENFAATPAVQRKARATIEAHPTMSLAHTAASLLHTKSTKAKVRDCSLPNCRDNRRRECYRTRKGDICQMLTACQAKREQCKRPGFSGKCIRIKHCSKRKSFFVYFL